jgi:hypothetical protein
MILPVERLPGQAKPSRAALDRADNLVVDVLVNIEAFGLHGQFSAERWVRLPASRGAGDADDNWVSDAAAVGFGELASKPKMLEAPGPEFRALHAEVTRPEQQVRFFGVHFGDQPGRTTAGVKEHDWCVVLIPLGAVSELARNGGG